MNHPLFALLVRWSVLALGVTLAAKIVPGIHYDTLGTLVAVVVLLSLFNAVLKPLMMLFSLPFIVLTLGFGVVAINALLFLLVGELVNGFRVDSFWNAMGGAIIVSVTNVVVSVVTGRAAATAIKGRRTPSAAKRKPDDVIDI